jgi:Stage II sporulation protein E (SpoIIE)
MVSDTGQHPSPPRRRQRLAVTIILGCCSLALTCIPAVAAIPADLTRTPAPSSLTARRPSFTIPPVTIPAVRIPPVSIPPVTIPTVVIPAVRTPIVRTPPVTIPPVAIPPIRRSPVAVPPVKTPPVKTHPIATPPVKSAPVAPPPVKASPVTIPTATTPMQTTPTAATATATTPMAATPTVAAKPPPLAAASRPVLTGRSHHAARRPRHLRARVASRTRSPAVSVSSAVAPVAAIPVTRARATRVGRTRAAAQGTPKNGRPSPLVTTITRIVSVVPTLLWILIGVLSALALALAVRSRLAALRARRLEQQRGELLEDVGLLQAALLPLPPARLGPVGTTAAYRPADGPGAGGDFYDVFALEDGQLAVIVGDISGHGRQALPHTALVRFTLRAYLEAGLSPRAAVQTAGAVLERQLGGSFATVVVATYQPRARILTYACAGHPPPLVLGSQSIAPITACSSPPIGAGMRTGTRQTVVSVPGRSQVCFHTDGVTESRVAGELFGAERLARTLAELGHGASASALLDRVAEETDTRPDDMAACLLNVEGASAAPAILVEELELDHDTAASDRTEQFLLACGLQRDQVAELMCSARFAARDTGTVFLKLNLADRPPSVELQRDNVALLHTRLEQPRAALRASQ